MILYSCGSCDFGIGGSHPETAEDEYELRQDIEAHEEFHRGDDRAVGESAPAADEALRLLAEQGLVVLPVEPKPLAHEEFRTIVREGLPTALVVGLNRIGQHREDVRPPSDADLCTGRHEKHPTRPVVTAVHVEDADSFGRRLVERIQDRGCNANNLIVRYVVVGTVDGKGRHCSSPSVDGGSSPTVGDGQVTEGVDTSSATALSDVSGEASQARRRR
ncbi:hypothetical protein, partial [Rhodococcus opacus]|uniref:hypothetical protein n=1 Tax=Rhodococcus opacus TaxID=37919 RepID=UPI001C551858